MTKPYRDLRLIGAVLFSALISLFFYTLLHEGGHALVGLALGGHLNEFTLSLAGFGPHIHIIGDFSATQSAWINVAGISLPLVALAAFLVLAPKPANPMVEFFKLMFAMATINSLLAWIVLPLLPPGTVSGDDVIHFLANTGLHPWLLALSAALLYIGFWALLLQRAQPISQTIGWLRSSSPLSEQPAARRSFQTLLGVFAASVLLYISIGMLLEANPYQSQAPEGYRLLQRVPMEVAHEDALLTELAPPNADLIFVLEAVQIDYLDVHLVGNGESTSLFHAEDYRSDRDQFVLSIPIPDVDYRVLLTNQAGQGSLAIFTAGD